MGLKSAGDGAATLLNAIDGLRAFGPSKTPDSVNELPAAVILIGETDYNVAFGGDPDHELRVILLISKADTPSAYTALYDFMEPTGAKSIVAILEADKTLGGNCDTIIIRPCTGAGQTMWGGVPYLSAVWPIEVYM